MINDMKEMLNHTTTNNQRWIGQRLSLKKAGGQSSKIGVYPMILMFFMLLGGSANAQTAVHGNMQLFSGDTLAEFSDELFIGASANITVDGVWYLASTDVTIDPGATIQGSGTIVFGEQNTMEIGGVPLTDATVEIDGGGVEIDCDVKLLNAKNAELVASDLKLLKDLEFAKDDAHILLGANDLILGGTASLTYYSENRYVVTDGSGNLVKEGLTGEFTFPVGASEGTFSTQDYTPASLNNSGTADEYSVRVDQSVTDGASNGVNDVAREWYIAEATSGGSNVVLKLQHNESTEEATYDNDFSYVARYVGTSPNSDGGNASSNEWDIDRSIISSGSASGTLTTGSAIANASVQQRTITDFSAYTYFTKLSNSDLCVSARAFLQAPLVGTSGSIMHDSLRAKSLIPTSEPYSSITGLDHYGSGGGETTTSSIINASGNDAIVDWVMLDLIDRNSPSTVIESQSVLLQRDGDIISAIGDEMVCFSNLNADSFYIGIRHRNHLPIQTSAVVEIGTTAPTVDFSTASLYGTNSTVSINGVSAMWAGNPKTDKKIVFSGSGEDVSAVANGVLNHSGNFFDLSTYQYQEYSILDVNMDGKVIFTGVKNDIDIIKNNVVQHPSNMFKVLTYNISGTRP